MKIAILHYSAPPIVGGVEAVIHAHAKLLLHAGHSVTIFTGAGDKSALPSGAEFVEISEMDSRHPQVEEVSKKLEAGIISPDFQNLSAKLEMVLGDSLHSMDYIIVHNVFTKHFNLPLTDALIHLLDQGRLKNCIAWCHDISWTSPHARVNLHQGYPWDLLQGYRRDLNYVTISHHRQKELAGLLKCPLRKIKVVFNGVNPADLYGLSDAGQKLIEQLDLNSADLILIMPVRITQAKNIEFAFEVTAAVKAEGIQPRLVVTGPPDPHDPGEMEYYLQLVELRHTLRVEREARFVYECNPEPGQGYSIDQPLVWELYRASDALFMPSHREGFGMPVLEAGMLGLPIFCTEIPAAKEIGGREVNIFSLDTPAEEVARLIVRWMKTSRTYQLRQRIRRNYTWQAIFQNSILPLFSKEKSS